jgi:hypothetical protein
MVKRNYEAEFDDGIGAMRGKRVIYYSEHRRGSKGNEQDARRAAVKKFGVRACQNITLCHSALAK